MKQIIFFIGIFGIVSGSAVLFSFCTTTPATANINKNQDILAVKNPVVGKWYWVASAEDENKNGIADDNEWHYGDAEIFKFYEEKNLSLEITFNADGTGYEGKIATDSTKFKWVYNAKGEYLMTKNTADPTISFSEIYFGKNGELIEKSVGEVMAAGQKFKQTAFEMFKKDKPKINSNKKNE